MIKSIWETLVYEPFYNTLVFILNYIPGHYAWVGIILLTITIRVLLFPVYQKIIKSQKVLKEIQPKIKEIQEKYKEDRQTLALKVMEVYREKKINPFSMIGYLVFVQIPIFLGLYFVFAKGLVHHQGSLYSFIHFPEVINTYFLNIDLMVKGSFLIALLAGVAQYLHSRNTLSLQPELPPRKQGEMPNFQDELQRSLRFQTLYFIPVLITVTAYYFPAAIGLYWIVNSFFSIAQEKFVQSKDKK